MAQTHARGKDIWIRLDDVKHPTNASYTYFGEVYYLKPFTTYGSILFISGMGGGESLYVKGDELKSEKTSLMIKAENIDIAVKKASSAAGIIMIYRVTVKFMIYAFPGGQGAAAACTAFSVAVFFRKHSREIEEALGEFKTVATSLAKVFAKYPKLGQAMLCVALQQASGEVSKEIKEKGFARFIIDNLDWEKFAEDVASLMGALLHAAVGAQGKSAIAWMLGKAGLKKLAMITRHLHDIYKKVKTVIEQARKVKKGPPVKDKPALAAKLITAFAEAGVTLTKDQAMGIVEEDSIFGVEAEQVRTVNTIIKARNAAEKLEEHVEHLAEAADAEIF